MKAVVFTLGCKVNGYESLALMSGLKELGYEVSGKLSAADLYIINTCAVTKEAERKSRQAIARVRKFSPDAKIIVTGCASQKDPESFLKKEGVYLVTGALNKDKIIELLNQHGIVIDSSDEYYRKYYPTGDEKTRYYLKVQDGCNNFCSYCIIPYLRGRSRSRSVEDVIEELKSVNALEVVLTGINLSAYFYEGKDLADLITAMSFCNARIRLGSLEDNVVDEKLIKALKGLKDFAPHFHLSLQSGSDKVLKNMNRHYTTEVFTHSVDLIRENFEGAAITTDVIVGYATETDEDFEKTYEFCEKTRFADIHCFEYSPREGTFGYKLPQLAPEVKKARLDKLLDLKRKLKKAFAQEFIGKRLSFVPEQFRDGYTEGYTGNYLRVYVEGRVEFDGVKNIEIIGLFKDGLKAKSI